VTGSSAPHPPGGGRPSRRRRRPQLPVDLAGRPEEALSRLASEVAIDEAVMTRLGGVCSEVDTSMGARVGAACDWWPVAVGWAQAGLVPAIPAAVAVPWSAQEVAAILAVCSQAGVPVTPVAGRSGVCGGSVPVFGGVALDLTAMAGITAVDDTDLLVDILPGTWGDEAEHVLRSEHGLTLGHWPQSMAMSTVGGWLACRSAGQYSTRYGKIEDLVVDLEVALADGRLIRTGHGAPRSAMGPDLTQVFVGSEGTLGVITAARLRAHPLPPAERRGAWAFDDMASGLDACRRILRRGATPAVLRLYDSTETARHFGPVGGDVLIVIDEGDDRLVDATIGIVAGECAAVTDLGPGPATSWFERRNEVPSLADLAAAGIVADTIEIAASWRALPAIYTAVMADVAAIDGTIAVSAHESHAYPNGACLYFSFGGRPTAAAAPTDALLAADAYYRSVWDAVMTVTRRHGGAVSHHHGIGINRGRYLSDALGDSFAVLVALKAALDPAGVLNPGKLGLPSPFGPPPWPQRPTA
jgi:alkyldihydroxyacetonephosphate synthase